MNQKIALVTGANRGIGKEVAHQLAALGHIVWIGSRELAAGERAASELRASSPKLDLRVVQLAVDNETSAKTAVARVLAECGRIDILVNNAGVFLDLPNAEAEGETSIFTTALEPMRQSFEINTLAPLRLIQLVAPAMRREGYGRIVNLSSGMGQLSEMNGGYPAYRLSKTALNAVTKIAAQELAGSGILVNSVCPGWVRTDMGGKGADLPVEEGADTPVWLATLPKDGPTGGFFREREAIDW